MHLHSIYAPTFSVCSTHSLCFHHILCVLPTLCTHSPCAPHILSVLPIFYVFLSIFVYPHILSVPCSFCALYFLCAPMLPYSLSVPLNIYVLLTLSECSPNSLHAPHILSVLPSFSVSSSSSILPTYYVLLSFSLCSFILCMLSSFSPWSPHSVCSLNYLCAPTFSVVPPHYLSTSTLSECPYILFVLPTFSVCTPTFSVCSCILCVPFHSVHFDALGTCSEHHILHIYINTCDFVQCLLLTLLISSPHQIRSSMLRLHVCFFHHQILQKPWPGVPSASGENRKLFLGSQGSS